MHRVDGLVLLAVALVVRDVGRRGHVARLVDGLVQREALRRREAHQAAAAVVLQVVDHLAGQHDGPAHRRVDAALAVLDHRTLLQALAGLDQALPHVAERVLVLAALEQQRLAHAARALLVTHEPRGHHAGLVRDHEVARLEVVHDVVEVPVLDAAVVAVQHEQPAGVPRLRRLLRDELLGEVVVKVVCAHASLHVPCARPCGRPRLRFSTAAYDSAPAQPERHAQKMRTGTVEKNAPPWPQPLHGRARTAPLP